MNKASIYRISLFITFITSLLGMIFKIQHFPFGGFILAGSAFISLGFLIPGLQDVYNNQLSRLIEKLMWTIGMIFLSWVAGYLYWPTYKRHCYR